jgi:hypothetical protein
LVLGQGCGYINTAACIAPWAAGLRSDAGFGGKLFESGGVAARPGFPPFPTPGLAIGQFLATLEAELVE